jgi:Family of unknown function (DUF6518)
MTTIRTPTWSAPGLTAGLVGACGLGLAAGAVTAYLQRVLPPDWDTLANSGAVWTVFAFLATLPLARRPAPAVAGSTGLLVGEVVGYYVYLARVEHLAATAAEQVLWTLAALWIGPLVGLGAFAVRWGSGEQRSRALLALCGVVGGEGAYLWRIAEVPRAGLAEVVLALLGGVVVSTTVPVSGRGRLTGAATGLLIGAAVYLAYRQPMLA